MVQNIFMVDAIIIKMIIRYLKQQSRGKNKFDLSCGSTAYIFRSLMRDS